MKDAAFFERRSSLCDAERKVLVLSRREPLVRIIPAGAVRRIGRRLFAISQPNPLADPRLEALRRYAVMVRRLGKEKIASHVADRAAAAFTAAQLAEVRTIIAREAHAGPAAPSQTLGASTTLIALIALQAPLQRLIATYLMSGPVGLFSALAASGLATPLLQAVRRSVTPARHGERS